MIHAAAHRRDERREMAVSDSHGVVHGFGMMPRRPASGHGSNALVTSIAAGLLPRVYCHGFIATGERA
jgi:hypothetical protein